MKKESKQFDGFSTELFWDVDPGTLSLKEHKQFIVKRVLEYGSFDDWKLLVRLLGLEEITAEAKKMRELEKRALNFIALLSKTPKEDFRCYTFQQSIPQHWNF